jgi:adenine phosphoribosyltransferase
MKIEDALSLIRQVPDYPKPGILFQDITPLLANSQGLAAMVSEMSKHANSADIVAGIEARGFILGSALALNINSGFVPMRKSGKLPFKTFSEKYSLEYGHDQLEVHIDAFSRDQRVLIVDDVLATGGTLLAAIELAKKSGAQIAGIVVLIELGFLNGRELITAKYPEVPITSVVTF